MVKRFALLFLLVLSVLAGLVVLSQTSEEQSFTVVRQIGRLRPQGIQYDPNFDRFAWVNQSGQLALVDAATYNEQAILYEQGAYNAYAFSNNGAYLALAIERRVELWDTQSGELLATFEPEGALDVTAPLRFSDDDTYLLVDTVVPAPAATRRSENDTSIIPWLWDLQAGLDIGPSRLRNRDDAIAFFNFRNGLILGPGDIFIAGVPERLQVINGRDPEQPVVNEIVTGRAEIDPISVWRSASNDLMYVRPISGSNLVQVNGENGDIFDIPLGRELTYGNIRQMEGLQLSDTARIIGEPVSINETALARLIFGGGYRSFYNYQPLTIMLLDVLEPMTDEAGQSALLTYTFAEDWSRGVLELIRPIDVQKMVLSPDGDHLMVRRTGDVQPIEVYDLTTGVLEQSFVPAEQDFSGFHTFAYNATGDVILSDFQRFDAETGQVLLHDKSYNTGFSQFFFSEEGNEIITLNGTDWRVWDITTGENIRQETLNLGNGELIATWPDGQRFLTRQFNDSGGVTIEIIDVGMQQRRTEFIFEVLPGRSVQSVIPDANWENFIVVYGSDVGIYNIYEGEQFYILSENLPPANNRRYGWLDGRTIYVSSDNVGFSPNTPIYGLEYHGSGLPMCMVETYPDDWPSLLPLWEQFNWYLSESRLNGITQQLCDSLPQTIEQVPDLLTPTPRFTYQGDATRIPIAVVGVPECLTSAFQREALSYAEAWRSMTVGLTEEEIVELEDLLCEGLVTSIFGAQPTPTVDPNTINPITPTPLPEGPQTTDGGERGISVMTIDIETQTRAFGQYFPPVPDTSRNINLVLNDFQERLGFYPNSPKLSPDGQLLSTLDNNGFVVIYQLGKAYDLVAEDVTATRDAELAEEPRSIGLRPTATVGFDRLSDPLPTVTPTITVTPPPTLEARLEQSNYGEIEELCPSDSLFDLTNRPPDYAVSGRMVVSAVANPSDVAWVLEPGTGRLYPDERIRECEGDCSVSYDGKWQLERNNEISVSRLDGSQRTVLFTAEEAPVWPQSFSWIGEHILEYSYSSYLPDERGLIPLLRRFDPTTGELSEPFQPPELISINNLPTNLSLQPVERRFALATTPYISGGGTEGRKYYIYDYQTDTAQHFASLDDSSLQTEWHPLGDVLYYRYLDHTDWYVFDTETQQHSVFGERPSGTRSRDGRYYAQWVSAGRLEQVERVLNNQPLPKISIWDRETGLTRQYCIPETGLVTYGTAFTWSPDNRYIVFQVNLPLNGDSGIDLLRAEAEVAIAQGRDAAESFGIPQEFLPTPFPTVSRFAETFPTALPTVIAPTSEPVSLETQYQLQSPRTLVLDTHTGTVTIISDEIDNVRFWVED